MKQLCFPSCLQKIAINILHTLCSQADLLLMMYSIIQMVFTISCFGFHMIVIQEKLKISYYRFINVLKTLD